MYIFIYICYCIVMGRWESQRGCAGSLRLVILWLYMIYVCMYVYIYVCIHMYIFIYICYCIVMGRWDSQRGCATRRRNEHFCLYMMYVCIYICMYTHVYIYIHLLLHYYGALRKPEAAHDVFAGLRYGVATISRPSNYRSLLQNIVCSIGLLCIRDPYF